MSRAFVIFAIVPAALALAAPASADVEMRQERVIYSDLDIDGQAGARVMLRRIEQAAQRACGAHDGKLLLETRAQVNACVDEAVRNAVSELDNPSVSAMHRGATRIALREE